MSRPPIDPSQPCPCGSERPYRACCQPWHQGQPAPTPETLMRSRYTAFVLGLTDYLRETWHPTTRPAELALDDSPVWVSLQILSANDGCHKGSDNAKDKGQVHFRAIYRAGAGFGYLEENSDFTFEQGRWFYVAGDTREGTLKPGRNEPCPCGSGKKYKACCC